MDPHITTTRAQTASSASEVLLFELCVVQNPQFWMVLACWETCDKMKQPFFKSFDRTTFRVSPMKFMSNQSALGQQPGELLVGPSFRIRFATARPWRDALKPGDGWRAWRFWTAALAAPRVLRLFP